MKRKTHQPESLPPENLSEDELSEDLTEDEAPSMPEDRFERRKRKKANAEEAMLTVERLLELRPQELDQVPFEDDALLDEMKALKQMKADGARKRQCRYMATRVANDSLDAIVEFLNARSEAHHEDVAHEHALEAWRDKVVNEGDAGLDALCQAYPQADRASLRQLMLKARREQSDEKPKIAYRALLKAIRKLDQGED